MICIDMDGTLLNSKHEVSERNKKAIKEAIDKGDIDLNRLKFMQIYLE